MKFLAQGNTTTGGASHSPQLIQLECNICSMYKCHGYLIGKQVSYKIKHSNTYLPKYQSIAKSLSNQYYNGSIKLIAIKLRGTESHNEWDCISK